MGDKSKLGLERKPNKSWTAHLKQFGPVSLKGGTNLVALPRNSVMCPTGRRWLTVIWKVLKPCLHLEAFSHTPFNPTRTCCSGAAAFGRAHDQRLVAKEKLMSSSYAMTTNKRGCSQPGSRSCWLCPHSELTCVQLTTFRPTTLQGMKTDNAIYFALMSLRQW